VFYTQNVFTGDMRAAE